MNWIVLIHQHFHKKNNFHLFRITRIHPFPSCIKNSSLQRTSASNHSAHSSTSPPRKKSRQHSTVYSCSTQSIRPVDQVIMLWVIAHNSVNSIPFTLPRIVQSLCGMVDQRWRPLKSIVLTHHTCVVCTHHVCMFSSCLTTHMQHIA